MKKHSDLAEYPSSFNQLISEKIKEFGSLEALSQHIKSLHPPEPKKLGRPKTPRKAYYNFYTLVEEIYDNKLLYDEKLKRKASYSRIFEFLNNKGNVDGLRLVDESELPQELCVTLSDKSYYEQLTNSIEKVTYLQPGVVLSESTYNYFKAHTVEEFSKHGIKPVDWYIYHEVIPNRDASIAEQAREIKRLMLNDEIYFQIDSNPNINTLTPEQRDQFDIGLEQLIEEILP